MLRLTWRHLFFLLPKQAQDNITSIRLLRREVLQNISVIRPRGRCGWSSVSSGAEGLSGEVDRRLRFCLRLGLPRTRLGSEPEKSVHGVIIQDLGYLGNVCGGMGRGWRLRLINTCLHLARELPSVCISLLLCRLSGGLLGSLPFPFFSHTSLFSHHPSSQ